MKTFSTMVKTELKLALRGIDMLIFAIAMPSVIAVILGIIYGNKPAFTGAEYTFFEQSFGALASIALCAAGVMGLPLVITDYRKKKVLKRYKVTPVSPVMLIFVQVIVYMMQCLVSLGLVYAVSALLFGYRMTGSFGLFFLSYMLVLISLYSIGIMIGGVSPNEKTVNILCSVLYFPMIVFSGATLPYEVMPKVLQKIADFMPLTQGIKLLKGTSLGLPIDDVLFSVVVMLVIAAICSGIGIKFFKWE